MSGSPPTLRSELLIDAIYVKFGFKCPNCGFITEVDDEVTSHEYKFYVDDYTPGCNTCESERSL